MQGEIAGLVIPTDTSNRAKNIFTKIEKQGKQW